MLRKITKAILFTINVLIAYLVSAAVEDIILQRAQQLKPLSATAIGMIVIVMIFFPLFSITEKITEEVMKFSLKTSKGTFGKRFGLIVFTLVALLILYNIYLELWFNLGVVDAIFRK
ncbi:MAG: hypothetical protein ACK5C0_05500 [Candidatus Kapaibacterium sp.]|jgi:hypothetical protein